jgi:hypothetical protein
MSQSSRDPEEAKAQVEKLGRQADGLAKQVQALGEGVGVGVAGLRRRTGWHSRAIWLLAGSFLFDVILTVAIMLTGWEVKSNAEELEKVQKVTQEDALCPLYSIFVAAAKAPPPPPNPGESNEGYKRRMEERDDAFKIIAKGYDALQCEKRKSKNETTAR